MESSVNAIQTKLRTTQSRALPLLGWHSPKLRMPIGSDDELQTATKRMSE